ncbi:hypothetical protein DFP72DRAFT_1172008 [Ephemerocybe angulata]|uniref:F-box domain-containing protein n=1 Tax=Ephemerocybe angulata TaxID=980116 RepID=A0A8H6HU68_9AGAR|nr:hypothetical protein DFP72DRAFT_1172008 [Tulosesus angulatus]
MKLWLVSPMTSITGSFQHLQKTFSKQLQYTSPCPGEEALKMSPTTLSELPIELLTKVFMNLELNDILRARTVCKSMHSASRILQVWRSLALRSIGTTLPQPFFFPKPLQECSSSDIESSIRRWEADWALKSPLETVLRPVVMEGQSVMEGQLGTAGTAKFWSFCMVPGGQFAIAGMTDGSVWAYNLSDDPASSSTVRAKLLVPTPFPSQDRMQLHLAMDYVSDEALGDTRGTCCLSQFNLAVIALPRAPPNGLRIANISVWRICISRPGNAGTSGRHEINLGGRLASFMAMADAGFFGLSLYGNAIAYGLVFPSGSRCTVITQWQDANGKKEHDEFLRWYIPDTLPMASHLLPGDRIILAEHLNAAMYNWRLHCPTSTLPPSEHQLRQLERVPLRNVHTLVASASDISISSPFLMRGTTRLVVLTREALHSLTIPVDGDNSQAGAIQESQLLLRASDFCPSGRFAAPWYFELGFCRAVGIHGGKDLSAIYAVQYRVEDDHVPETAPYQPTYERHPHTFDRRPSHILYDQFTNRVVLTDIKLSHFITLSSHASHAVDDDEVLVEGREDDMIEGTFPSAAN